MFVVEALQALHGDALLLHGTNTLVMVDGGPDKVYDRTLRPRLKGIGSAGPAAKIDLLVVSHIDDDHLKGVLDLTDELVEAKFEHRAPVANIRNIWHNSFSDDLLGDGQTANPATTNDTVAGAVALADLADGDADLAGVLRDSSRLVLSSVRQGRRLRRDASLLRIRANSGFADGVVLRRGSAMETKRIGRFTFGILGPAQPELAKLRTRWKRDLKKILKTERGRVAALALAADLDESVANLASLVLQVTADGQTALLTGDARSDHILAAMGEIGWPDSGKWPVDLLKVPHHGSDRNVTRAFFEKVPARHYVISGDGKHGNPEPETFEMIFAARGDAPFELHLTYGPEALKRHPDFDWRGFKQVINRHDGWNRLRFPDPGQASINITLA